MQRITIAVSAAALICSAMSAFAEEAKNPVVAQLTDIQGSVLVDVGTGFTPVAGPVGLRLGDRVVVNEKGEAILSYGPACKLPLLAPSMTTVANVGCVIGTQDNEAEDKGTCTDGDRSNDGIECIVPIVGFVGGAGIGAIGGIVAVVENNDNAPGNGVSPMRPSQTLQ